MNRPLAAMLALFVPLSFLCGCSSPADSGGDPPDDPIEWEIRDSQQHVLDNLVTAYENKKAEEYLDCLSEDFIFYLNPEDVKNDPTLPYYWDKPEERDVHEAMFSGQGADGGVDRIELTLTQDGDPIPVEVAPGVFHYQYKEGVDLRVHMRLNNLIYQATAPSLYELRIDDQVGPNGEPLWEICSWRDLDGGGGLRSASVPSDVEPVSLGVLKQMFRE
jgi:hypothetical protein